MPIWFWYLASCFKVLSQTSPPGPAATWATLHGAKERFHFNSRFPSGFNFWPKKLDIQHNYFSTRSFPWHSKSSRTIWKVTRRSILSARPSGRLALVAVYQNSMMYVSDLSCFVSFVQFQDAIFNFQDSWGLAFWGDDGYEGGGLRNPSLHPRHLQWHVRVAETDKALNAAWQVC